MEDAGGDSHHVRHLFHPRINTRARTASQVSTAVPLQSENPHINQTPIRNEAILNSETDSSPDAVFASHQYAPDKMNYLSPVPLVKRSKKLYRTTKFKVYRPTVPPPLDDSSEGTGVRVSKIQTAKNSAGLAPQENRNGVCDRSENASKKIKVQSPLQENERRQRGALKRKHGCHEDNECVIAARKDVVKRAKAYNQELSQNNYQVYHKSEERKSSWEKVFTRLFRPFRYY